ncbi:MAG: hypothetical protein ACXVA9_07030 [Bdellovibrionales bacterium]
MSFRAVLSLSALLLCVACGHKTLRAPEGNGIYPYGKYQHSVKVKAVVPGQERIMEMRGVVSYSADFIRVIGLSTFGTTLFRIEENLKTGELKKEFYMDVIRQHEERFIGFYRMIRELLTAPKGSTDFKRGDAHFALSEPDDHAVYRKIHVDHPQVVLDIKVDDYEF